MPPPERAYAATIDAHADSLQASSTMSGQRTISRRWRHDAFVCIAAGMNGHRGNGNDNSVSPPTSPAGTVNAVRIRLSISRQLRGRLTLTSLFHGRRAAHAAAGHSYSLIVQATWSAAGQTLTITAGPRREPGAHLRRTAKPRRFRRPAARPTTRSTAARATTRWRRSGGNDVLNGQAGNDRLSGRATNLTAPPSRPPERQFRKRHFLMPRFRIDRRRARRAPDFAANERRVIVDKLVLPGRDHASTHSSTRVIWTRPRSTPDLAGILGATELLSTTLRVSAPITRDLDNRPS